MNYRDFLQQLIYKIVDPLVNGMVKVGITPNFITTTGLILNILATGLMVYGVWYRPLERYVWMGWAGGIVLFAGLFDMLDGRVARVGNMSTTFGALYDSVLDRYSELVTYFGICFFLFVAGEFAYAIVAFVALIGSLMVSYVRARAEGLGIECKVGLMQRPERVVLTALGALFCGIFESLIVLMIPIALIALLANWTAFVRINHCRKVMQAKKE
ncbi:CDP-alcohol phosphatidyltransferase family protein [Bacteroides heparinolyticus]|uniref:CDP-alcohol phosphatidyltransferase family protein n=1 Tax=Prevotella heparinolytica TaxID=28113 RepID=UPI00359F2C7A